MLRVGLTGGIASGKSTLTKLFAKHGVPIIDADKISHNLTTPGSRTLHDIVEHFGRKLLNVDGSLNRAHLRHLIFNNPKHRVWLNNLMHPRIRSIMEAQIKAINSLYCICDIPLLSESTGIDFIDRIIVVDIDPDIQLERLMVRNNFTKKQAEKIIANQHPRKLRLNVADDVITNNGNLTELRKQVDLLHQKLRTL